VTSDDLLEEPAVSARVAELFAADTASAALGIEVLEAARGRARLRMTVRPDMVQGHATCHGGLLFTLADSAFAAACNQGPGGPVVGASAEITWVAAAFTGDVLEAEAVEHTRYGRNGVTDVTVRRAADGGVVALFRGRSLELRESAAERATA
jgi:acyl-CoA thioesterase